ncbi:hypothetical protein HYALB_00013015 [Hymenoscyphus albidus]|uniref:Uncharacterized protein n=1 Tax=Hymenoscyphus albidus TaxID=595503 RepID=A0A9N9LUW7_9HELO|nr:hypothetical protein HYALB_00013015 [Hymenoscyphus albidus]
MKRLQRKVRKEKLFIVASQPALKMNLSSCVDENYACWTAMTQGPVAKNQNSIEAAIFNNHSNEHVRWLYRFKWGNKLCAKDIVVHAIASRSFGRQI